MGRCSKLQVKHKVQVDGGRAADICLCLEKEGRKGETTFSNENA